MTLTTDTGKTPKKDREGRHSKGRYIARILLSLLFAVGLFEAILRFGLGLGNPILIEPDSACAYILKPDQQVVRFFVRARINHNGMRSDEVPSEHKAGVLRLLFVGDSVTYGTTQVDQKNIFTEVLHRDLPAIVHCPVEVLNASAGAWAPDNELSYIQSRGIFQSDVVLLVLNDGDLTQPRSTIADVGDGLPVRRPATAIGELYTRYLRPRMAHFMSRADAGDSVAGNADEVTRENLSDIEEIDRLVTDQGARLMIVYIPFRRDLPEASKRSASILHDWSEVHHVTMLDLTSTEEQYSSKDITLDNGIHLNAHGHLAVAQAIERAWAGSVGAR